MATSLRDTFVSTRGELSRGDSRAVSGMFREHFHLQEGDYLEIRPKGIGSWKSCRILTVQRCYSNQAGGYTADLTVARLLASGQIGTGRYLTVVTVNGVLGGLGEKVDAPPPSIQVRKRTYF